MAGDAYWARWARCDCNLGGRVVSSGMAVCITPSWVVASATCMEGPCGPRVRAVADHGHRPCRLDDEVVAGKVGDSHVQ